MDEERKRLIDKISKLLTLSEDSAAFENERGTARSKCGQLLAKYGIKLSELDGCEAMEIRTIKSTRKRINYNEFGLFNAIGEFCGCLLIWSTDKNKRKITKNYNLIGRYADIESSIYLFEVVSRQIQLLTSEHKAQCKKYKKSCKSYSYIQGLCFGIKERMGDICNEVLRYQQKEGLVPVNIFKQRKNEAKEWFEINNKIETRSRQSLLNDTTYKGICDAKRIIIHAPVSAKSTKAMIEKIKIGKEK